MTADRRDLEQRARRLGTARRRMFLVRSASAPAALVILWASGFSTHFWDWAQRLAGHGVAALVLYVAGLLVVLACVELPFAWYGGYRLSQRFGLSRQTSRAWFIDWLKGASLGGGLTLVAVLVFYAALTVVGSLWWLVVGVLGTLAVVLLSFIAPYVLIPIFFRMRPLEDHDVVATVQALFAAAGAELRGVFTLDFSRRTAEANAAVLGLGRSRRVVLADTLLEQFPLPEIRAVVAHELGHHLHRDVQKLVAAQSLLIWIALGLAAGVGDELVRRAGARGLADPGALPLVLLGVELYGLAMLPLVNGWSRRIEAAADRFALRLTGDPAAFISAMRRLAAQNLVELEPPRWAELLLASHPSLGRRIRAAEEVSGERVR